MRILVPVDFSECSVNAVKAAASIARKSDGKLFLLHIVSLPAYLSDKLEVIEQIPGGSETLQLIRRNFAGLLKMPFLRDVNAMEVILFENVYQTIINFAEENQIDLIVMGSHGASGFREFFIGSNTQKVVRMSECPVLTIKHPVQKVNINNVLLATDFGESSIMSFEKFNKLFRIYQTKIHLLKVITREEFETTYESLEKAENFVKALGLKNYNINIINHSSIHEGINDFAERLKPSLIALITEGRSQLYQIFNESIAEKLVNRSNYPVLSVKYSITND